MIMSGVSGAGKSSWVESYTNMLHPDSFKVFSTDTQHLKDGVYVYDATKAGEYHNNNLRWFAQLLAEHRDRVDRYAALREKYAKMETPPETPDPEDMALLAECEADKIEVVFVDNTNIRQRDYAAYYRLAEAYGHAVEIIRVAVDPDVAAARNTHGLSAERVRQMYADMDPIPRGWNFQYVTGHVGDASPPPVAWDEA